MPASLILVLFALTAALVLVIGRFSWLTRSREGKVLAFMALLILPALSVWAGFNEHMERATSTSFCLSCHVMTDYGRSLLVDDRSYIPARHFQSNLIPRDHACYTCHTDYTMFGTVKSKIRGMRHLWVQYAGAAPKAADIKLYTPFNNRECLHCHLGSRKFEEVTSHHKTPELLGNIKAGTRSCMSGGCHDTIHDVGSLKDAALWREGK
jgi:cytochrome c-type protein NapC